ncbi:hypothetical protein FJQ98_01400 [Lysinibacillus agricola]|uniref:Uncharacterized protein n=1 Tax=Lysinibacillus agricola TaxID=2590012 RepID=A0ABX7ASK9_9BACI|nr:MULTISPECIES: hypothetical protein [Lysinibacillus]QQP12779.1 hypothetical protein FJQ98_01400 [Lysinibacillus agricola]
MRKRSDSGIVYLRESEATAAIHQGEIDYKANSVKTTATAAQMPKNHHVSVKSSLESLFM